MVRECFLEIEVCHLIASGIVIEHAVESYRMLGNDGGAETQFRLQGTAGADANEGEHTLLFANLARLEIDIGEGIEFVDNDVDVVGSDTMTETHYGLALVSAAYSMELTA